MCVYVCVYAGMCVCMRVCMNACMYACVYVCMRVCMHACMYVCVYVCMFVYVCVCLYVCMCVRMQPASDANIILFQQLIEHYRPFSKVHTRAVDHDTLACSVVFRLPAALMRRYL